MMLKVYLSRSVLSGAVALAATLGSHTASAQGAGPLELARGDRICLLGNALAERMQHHGWLETRLQSRFPDHQLSIRNLGFGADELTVSQRTMNFGKRPWEDLSLNVPGERFVAWDRYLAHCQADVIFAFFGYNESFAGEEGLEAFKGDLESFIQHTLSSSYNGQGAPRLVLFSSIPHEDLGDPILPDGRQHNARIELYTRAAAQVAEEQGVPFVDLFTPMRERYASSPEALTLNGIHLTENGDRVLAEVIESALFPGRAGAGLDPERLSSIRQTVLEKDLIWFNRYRATDGYNVYGGRSREVYPRKGQEPEVPRRSNFEVLQREMEVLDAMADDRDRRIWTLAQGDAPAVDPSDAVPPLIEVQTNKPGAGPRGAYAFLEGDEAIRQMTPAPGMQVDLFAGEGQFPELINPVQMAWDTKGRLWVAVWPTYPHWRPDQPRNDKLLILEDTDGDGRADTCKTFVDDLHNPTGFEFWNGGVLVANVPDLLFLKDTDGDDRVDVRQHLLHGLSSADTHHSANSFVIGPGGALYFQEGTFHQTQIETIYGPVRNHNGCVWRFEPRTWRVERYVPYNFANPHGHVFDHWGQDFVTDGTGNVNYYALPFSGRIRHPAKHGSYFPFFQQRSRPCAATEILSSRHFPAHNQGAYLIANVIGFQGIFQYQVLDDGAGFSAEEIEPIVHSSDPNFRPSDIEVGPDGAIYFLDWHNPLIGHLQHHLRDPSRDRTHGRVYRVSVEGREPLEPVPIAGRPIEELLVLLQEPDDRLRYRARIELSGRDTDAVLAAAHLWVEGLDPADDQLEHHLLEGLWLHQQHARVDLDLLNRLLIARDHRARAAATRVLRYMRRQVPGALVLLGAQMNDEHPRVRLEALVAASFFDSAEAAAVALEVLRHPTDRFIDYALRETMRALESHWKDALQAGHMIAANNPAGVDYLLGRLGPEELVNLPPMPAVLRAVLTRHGVGLAARRDAAAALAQHHGRTLAEELLEAIGALDGSDAPHAAHVLGELGGLLQEEAAGAARPPRAVLVRLARGGKNPATRSLGYASLVAHDLAVDQAWESAATSRSTLQAFLGGIPMIADADLRAALYPRVRPLMFALPTELQGEEEGGGKPARAADGGDLDAAFHEPVRGAAIQAMAHLAGHENQKFQDAAKLIGEGTFLDPAVELLRQIPPERWPRDQIRPVVQTLAAYVSSLPAEQRTLPGVVGALEMGRELATALPGEQAETARRELDGLGGSILLIRTVPHQMLYDIPEFWVQAGKPVAILFQNNDLMPHNLVITAAGAMERVGRLAEHLTGEEGGDQNQFVPDTDEVLWHTQLLYPGRSERLTFVAPSEPGEHPYVCTFPGHWRVMNGIMHVVEQLDEEQAITRRSTEGAAAPAREFVRDWKLDDLASALTAGWERDRSLTHGRSLFREVGCITCHGFRDEGARGGPDLTEIRDKYRGQDLLRHILEPSAEILEGYAYHYIVLEGGGDVIGRIVEDDGQALHVISNLQNPDDVTLVFKDEIAGQKETDLSPMPTGQLVTLTADDILDLLAYLESSGD